MRLSNTNPRTFDSLNRQTRPVRLGAVSYLNARPLTWALDQFPENWNTRYDVPSACAELLQDGSVDLGLIPSIEYLRGDYRFVAVRSKDDAPSFFGQDTRYGHRIYGGVVINAVR